MEEEFGAPGNALVRTGHALTKAALLRLSKVWPAALTFDELLGDSLELLRQDGQVVAPANAEAGNDLADALLAMYAAPIVDLHGMADPFALELPERPVVSAVVRRELAAGAKAVTSLRHATIRCEDEMGRQLMLLLDGTRNRQMLAKELARYCEQRGITLPANGRTARTATQLREAIAAGLEGNLHALARMAVLVR
jgi:hypothetical protein